MTLLIESFGIALRQAREARGWSQEQLADRSDLNRSYLGEVERGRAIASLATVEKLAQAFGVMPSTLVLRGEALSRQHQDRRLTLAALAG